MIPTRNVFLSIRNMIRKRKEKEKELGLQCFFPSSIKREEERRKRNRVEKQKRHYSLFFKFDEEGKAFGRKKEEMEERGSKRNDFLKMGFNYNTPKKSILFSQWKTT